LDRTFEFARPGLSERVAELWCCPVEQHACTHGIARHEFGVGRSEASFGTQALVERQFRRTLQKCSATGPPAAPACPLRAAVELISDQLIWSDDGGSEVPRPAIGVSVWVTDHRKGLMSASALGS